MLSRLALSTFLLCGLLQAQQVTISVSPTTASLRVNESRSFTATVRNTTNTAVQWTVTAGTITTAGRFSAPATIPAGGTVTVRATSAADPTKSATAVVTIQNAVPTITSLDPAAVNTGLPYTLRIRGSNFLPTSTVTLEGRPATPRFLSSTELEVSAVAENPAGNSIDVVVSNPDPGAAASNTRGLTVNAPVRVTMSPTTTTVRGGATVKFNSFVSNTSITTVDWFVNEIPGGNAAVGTVDATGLYTAPVAAPAAGRVEVKVVSRHDSRGFAVGTANLQNPVPVLSSATPTVAKTGTPAAPLLQPSPLNPSLETAPQANGSTTFTLNGSLFTPSSKVFLGSFELPTTYVSDGQLRAKAILAPVAGQLTTLRVVNPGPGGGESARVVVRVENAQELMSYGSAIRFLEQASYGADPQAIAKVQAIGRGAWLAEQFRLPATPLPDALPTDANGGNEGMSRLQTAWILNALNAPDQLRHRVAFALHSILVVSAVDLGEHRQYVPYLRILHEEAFGNYRQLLERITLNPAMGRYLNMLNNAKANPARNTVANENYARELMQLFTIGLVQLNPNGTPQTGNPASYDESHVSELAKVFTGWTSAPMNGAAPRFRAPDNWAEPMIPIEAEHDTTDKAILPGVTIPAGRMARQDLAAALDAIFNHPNVGPFVSYRLIQRLVTSNPSPAYVERVARVFNSNSRGVRGDLKEVVEAILTDAEAGTGAGAYTELSADQGSLREPLALTLNMIRALNMRSNGGLAGTISGVGQNLFYPGSVFSYFSPFTKPGPEFQALNATSAMNAVNLIYRLSSNGLGNSAVLDLNPWDQLATNSDALITAAANALNRGTLSSNARATILQAVNAQTSNRMKAITALYLVGASPQVLVKR
jgi:uncharacterized protein (DUF1800 family)